MKSSRIRPLLISSALMLLPFSVQAQEGTYVLPTTTTPQGMFVNPLNNERSDTLLGPTRTNTGPTAPAATTGDTADATGTGESPYSSAVVAGVQFSQSGDRFKWFYNASDLYTGVIPNIRDTLPHLRPHQTVGNARRPRNRITWIGFQPFDAYTRIFVQLAASPAYTISESEEGHLVEIIFENTSISLTNFQRFIDASYFGRSIDIIDAHPLPSRRSRMIIWRDQLAPYEVIVDGDYLYIDFHDVGH